MPAIASTRIWFLNIFKSLKQILNVCTDVRRVVNQRHKQVYTAGSYDKQDRQIKIQIQ